LQYLSRQTDCCKGFSEPENALRRQSQFFYRLNRSNQFYQIPIFDHSWDILKAGKILQLDRPTFDEKIAADCIEDKNVLRKITYRVSTGIELWRYYGAQGTWFPTRQALN